MRKFFASVLVGALSASCTTTMYQTRGTDPELRLTGKKPGETLLRTVKREVRHHYYLFGLIPHDNPVDLTAEFNLHPGEALVNTRIENSFDGIDFLITFGLGVVTVGISPIIWTSRTTTVQGDVVEAAAATPAAPVEAPKKKDEEASTPLPAKDAVLPASWSWLEGKHSQAEADKGCAESGLKLPSRAQLKTMKSKSKETFGKSDVWTSDKQDDDAWSFSFDGGITFLKDPEEKLPALCVKETANP